MKMRMKIMVMINTFASSGKFRSTEQNKSLRKEIKGHKQATWKESINWWEGEEVEG